MSESENKFLTNDKYLNKFNSTKADFDENLRIMDIFLKQTKENPNKIAIFDDKNILTYKELYIKSSKLALVLRKKGVKPDSLVIVMIERSIDMIIAIYGILLSGGAYLPIDPFYPKARKNYIIEDSNSNIIISNRDYSHGLNNSKEIIYIEEFNYDNINETSIELIGISRNIAYVIYTSGSTGNPKGVLVENISVINRILWMQKEYGINDKDIIMQKTPISFDVSVWELFWWMFVGATLFLLKPEGEKNPDDIIETILNHKITTIHFVPSMLSIFLEYVEDKNVINKISSLKQVFVSGEALSPYIVNKFNRLLNKNNTTNLINLYGPTEATVDVTHYPCYEKKEYSKIYIGKPIDNIRIYIIDEDNKLLPIGEEGELCIAGVGVARGYLNREDLTKEKFVDNPPFNEKRIYKTGDLAKWLPTGDIEYIGRTDFQIKIRGFRIEIGEIEEKIRTINNVKDVAVHLWNKNEQKYLCAYIICNEKKLTETYIKEKLKIDLPDYMIPEKVVFLNKFPLSPNGKLEIYQKCNI